MKTKFNTLFQTVLIKATGKKSFAEAFAVAKSNDTKAARREAARQCLADILKIRQAKEAKAAKIAKKNIPATSAAPAAADAGSTAVTKTFSIKDIFNVDVPKELAIAVHNHNPHHLMVPKADPDYVFRKEHLSDLLAFLMIGENSMYLCGPTGCGKSSILIEAAARMGIPLYNVVGHNRMETPELFGGFKLNAQGGMDWIPGPITLAAKNDAWVMVDEGDLLDPAALAGLNGVAEGRPFLIPETGELVTPGPNFRLFFTANSNGAGDATGLYQGVLRLNLAFMDRFYVAEFDYPAEETEINLIAKLFPAITEEIRKRMVAFANDIRGLFVKGEIEVTLSTRTLLRWAKIASFHAKAASKAKGAPNILNHSLDRALGFRAELSSRKALHEVLQRHFGTT